MVDYYLPQEEGVMGSGVFSCLQPLLSFMLGNKEACASPGLQVSAGREGRQVLLRGSEWEGQRLCGVRHKTQGEGRPWMGGGTEEGGGYPSGL